MRKWIVAVAVLVVTGVIAWFAIGHLMGSADAELPGGPGRPGIPRTAETRRPGARAARPVESAAPAGGILVLGVDGKPAWSASVATSAQGAANAAPGAWRELARVAMGRSVPPAEFHTPPLAFVRALGDGVRSAVTPWDARGVVLRLEEGCVVEGTVLDADRRPVPGVRVTARPGPDTTTGADGRFRLTGFDDGAEFDLRAAAGQDARAETRVAFTDGERRREVELVLPGVPQGALLAEIRFAVPPRHDPSIELVLADDGDREDARRTVVDLPRAQRAFLRIPWTERFGERLLRLRVSCVGFRATDVQVRIPRDRVDAARIDLPEGGLDPVGVVLDAQGNPVAGAEIHADRDKGMQSYVATRSAADGTFAVPSGAGLWVAAILRGKGASDWFKLDVLEGELVLRLGAGGIVEGTVRAEGSGVPVAGATVVLLVGKIHHEATWTTVTDEAGRYSFPAVPLGTDLVAQLVDRGRWSAIKAQEHEAFDEEHAKDKAAGIWGRLTKPGESWTCDLTAAEWRGVQAKFELRFPPGVTPPATVTVEDHRTHDTGWVKQTWDASLDPSAPAVERYLRSGRHRVQVRTSVTDAGTVEFDVDGDGPARTIVVELAAAPKGRIRARVVDAAGRPVAGPGLKLSLVSRIPGRANGLGEVAVGDDGTADVTDLVREAPVDDGRTIEFIADGPGLFEHGSLSAYPELVVPLAALRERRAASPDQDVVLDVRAAEFLEIDLRVTANESPVAGVVLGASPERRFAATELTTDARGVATLRIRSERDVGRDVIAVRARAPYEGRWTLEDRHSLFGDGGATRADGRWVAALHVEGGRAVRCVLVGLDGRPIAGARMSRDRRDGAEDVETDDDGAFTVLVSDEDERVDVDFTGWIVEPAPLAPGATEVRVVASRRRALRVAVHGVPADVAKLKVILQAAGIWSTGLELAGSGPDRTTEPIGAPSRPLRVTVYANNQRWRGTSEIGADAEIADVTLSRVAEHAVVVRVTYPDGTPVRGQEVLFDPIDMRVTATTDDDGVARLMLPEGSYPGRQIKVAGHVPEPQYVKLTVPTTETVRIVARK